MGETVRGYLVVKVLEAAGHNGEDRKVWDDTLKEAFVKSKITEFLFLEPNILQMGFNEQFIRTSS